MEEATQRIWSSMANHHLLPGALGTQAASLPHKASALMAQLRLETQGASHLSTFLSNVVSMCTDLGTEHGLADVTRSGYWQHFHSSLRHHNAVFADDVETDWLNEPVPDEHVADGEYLFERAIPVAGMLHIVSTCTGALHQGVFQHWKMFSDQLTAVTNLLCLPYLKDLFLQRCVRNTRLHAYESMFQKSFPRIVEWRWASLTQTLNWLLPLEGPLRVAWNAERFLDGCDEEAYAKHKFQVLRLAIPDSMFWAYAHTMHRLQLSLDKLAFWAENCPCHEKMCGVSKNEAATMREDVPHARLWQALMPDHQLQTSEWASCPMRSKRAPELAAGHLKHRLDEVDS